MSPTLEAEPTITSRAERLAELGRSTVARVVTGNGYWGRARLAVMLAVVVVSLSASYQQPWTTVGLLALFGITLDLAARRR